MNKQFELIQVEQNMEGIAVKKHNPLLKILKYALVGAVAFIALVLLFAVGSSVINPAIDSAMQKMGISESIVATDASPVAYAWTSPADSNHASYVANVSKDAIDYVSNTMLPSGSAITWNRAYSGTDHFNSNWDYDTNSKDEMNTHVIHYVDLKVDDQMRNAILNGQLNECTVKLKVAEVGGKATGTADKYIRITFFIARSTTVDDESGTGIGSFTTASSSVVHDQTNCKAVNSTEKTVSIALDGTERKIRFGVAFVIYCESRWTDDARICADAPTITSNFIGYDTTNSDKYDNGKIKFVVQTGTSSGSTEGGHILAKGINITEKDQSGKMTLDKVITLSYLGDFDVQAEANMGYYFSGWRINGGRGITCQNGALRYTYLHIDAGAYVDAATVTVTAYFRKITINDANKEWIYQQDEAGQSKLQGPYCTIPTRDDTVTGGNDAIFSIKGGEYVGGAAKDSTDGQNNIYYARTGGSDSTILSPHNANTLPFNAGYYTMVIRVYVENETTTPSSLVGFYVEEFEIKSIDISSGEGNINNIEFIPFDEEEYIIEPRVFSNHEYRPMPNKLKVKVTTPSYDEYVYILNLQTSEKDGDFLIKEYTNNKYVTDENYKASMTIDATNAKLNNFTGVNADITFDITPLNISTLSMDVSLAAEIQEKYNLTYNGYQQRPRVILIRLKGKLPGDGDVNAAKVDTIITMYHVDFGDGQGIYTDITLETNERYTPFFRIINIDIDSDGKTSSSKKDETKAYVNNVNACTYTADSTECAYLDIMASGGSKDLTGTARIYFDIAQLKLPAQNENEEYYSVEVQSETMVYTGLELKLKPDVVFITVKNQTVWMLEGKQYKEYENENITFVLVRSDSALKDLTNAENKALFDTYRAKCGSGVGLADDPDAESEETRIGQVYFTTWSGKFNITDYSNNTNVTRAGNSPTGEVIIGAGVNFKICTPSTAKSGEEENEKFNMEGSATTMFKILPLDLSADYIENGSPNGTIGFFANGGFNTIYNKENPYPNQTYTGAFIAVKPSVYAHVNNHATGVSLGADDFDYSYPNGNDVGYDNINVRKDGIVYATGKGNYEGTISITFDITPMIVTIPNGDEYKAGNIIPEMKDDLVEYTGIVTDKPENPLSPGDIIVFTIKVVDPETGELIDREVQFVAAEDENDTSGDFVVVGVVNTNKGAVSTAEDRENYLIIKLMGNYKDPDSKEYMGNYVCQDKDGKEATLTVYFGISQKDIGLAEDGEIDNITISTNWSSSASEDYSQLIYTGESFNYQNLPGNKNAHIIFTYSPTASGTTANHKLTYSTDYTIVGGGENKKAGTPNPAENPPIIREVGTDANGNPVYTVDYDDVGGYIVLQGKGNYKGLRAVPFTILQRDISSEIDETTKVPLAYATIALSGLSTDANNKYYTSFIGELIGKEKIDITSVTYHDNRNQSNKLSISLTKTDYDVSYGGYTVDGHLYDNINVLNGGVVVITGKGNFKGTAVVFFDIMPVDQKVKFDVAEFEEYNDGILHEETSVNDRKYNYYIDATNQTEKGIKLVAYTGAVQPDGSAVKITFKATARDSQEGTSTNKVIITYDTPVVIDGKSYTTAWLKFNNAYGIVYIEAIQTESGNFKDAKDEENTLLIYGKRADSANLEDLARIYGNPDESREPDFASGGKIEFNIEFFDIDNNKLNDSPISVISKTEAGVAKHEFTLSYLRAFDGVVKVVVSHNGYNDLLDDANSYIPFSQSFNVSVAKRPLTISIDPITIEYGAEPKFTYLYETVGFIVLEDGTMIGNSNDEETTLLEGDITEAEWREALENNPNYAKQPVIKGLESTYNKLIHSQVGEYGPDQIKIDVNKVDPNSISPNYDITYGAGALTITQKALQVFVRMAGQTGRDGLWMDYGGEFPTNIQFSYTGLVNAGDVNNAEIFTPPTIDYGSITKFSNVGSYQVKTTGGNAKNYIFEEASVTLEIRPVSVNISLETIEQNYTNATVTHGQATITGIADENATIPDTENGEIMYQLLTVNASGSIVATSEWPKDAGRYRVRVTFTPKEGDNYAKTVVDFTDAIIINKVAPKITLETAIEFEYTNEPIVAEDVNPMIAGISNNLFPKRTYVAERWFCPTGGDNEGCENSRDEYTGIFTQTPPYQIGVYDVIFVYLADPTDNYTDLTVRINGKVEILTGKPTISIKQEKKTFTYDGNAHGLDLANDFSNITYKPYGADQATILETDNTYLTYKIGDEWVTEAPKNVGVYNVKVEYVPTAKDAALVREASIEFFYAIEITPVDMTTGNYIKLNYTGTRRRSYNANGQPLDPAIDIIVTGVPGGTTPLGSIKVSYVKGNVVSDAPKDAGIYDIHIAYLAVEEDNYVAGTEAKVFRSAFEITRVNVSISTINSYSEVYNGAGKGASGVIYHGVMGQDGQYDEPKGTLRYQYKSANSSSYTDDLPTAVGSYDVRVIYIAADIDNYTNGDYKDFYKVITITKATPSIVINKMTVPYGDTIVVDYTIRGAQYDLNGPATELGNGIGRVTINYGTRFTTADGGAGYDWSTTAPIESGKYSIRVDFTAGSSSNYVSVTQTAFDCLTISNILPTFELADKVVVYDGSRHNAGNALVYDNNGKLYTKWDGVAVGKYYYRGTLGYEYNKVGTDKWTTLAPNEVGLYNVRVHYYENPTSDVFSATTLDFEGALEIKALEIKVMPIYGQGHIYDGTSTEGKAIAYVYSYMRDGYKYMVYSRVGDLDRNQVVDLSSAEYVDENGHVYTIVTDASMLNDAWRDYYEKMVTLVSGSFMDGDELITLEFSALGVTEGKGEFTAENGKNYVVDLDFDVVYISNDTTYNLKPATGYFFSIVDSEGKVNVIEINTSNIIYANGDTTIGTYIVTIAGRQTIYTINLSAKTASANGETYDIYNNIHLISYQKGSSTVDIKVDFSSFYYVSEDGNAVYKSANGETFLIDINTQEVQKVAELNIDTIEFSYIGSNNTQQTVVVDTNALEAIYSNNAYIGKYVTENLDFIINLKAKTVRVPTFYKMTINGQFYQFNAGRKISVQNTDMVATINKGVYTYANDTTIYYLDTNNMIAKDGANLFTFDVAESKLSQEVDGVNTAFDVDVREFSYKVGRNGKFVGTTTLYGNTYQVENATLIAGNSWGGTFSILAQGAGDYAIAQGTLSISGNYLLEYVKGVNFSIERAKLTVSFDGIEDAVYDGENKFIDYTISGILNDETVGVEQSYDGDNLNVTDGGYRTKITITSTNYYLEGGVSDWYYILPALMEPIVVEESKPIIYDGAKHYLELKNVERGASVSYAGSETAPYFVEPGTYSVIAIVSKPNHVSLEVELKLTITKAKYIVTALEVPGTLKYGDALPSLICDSNLGTIALDPTQVLLPSVTTYTWTFTPYSQEFYKFYEGNSADGNTITGTIELKVQKAQANIEVTGELIQSETNPSAIIGIANGLSTNESDLVTIEYIAGDGTRYAKMPTAPGKYTVRITYAGDENYAETVYTTVLTIEQESNFDWAIYVGSAILVLALLSTIFFLVRRQKKLD